MKEDYVVVQENKTAEEDPIWRLLKDKLPWGTDPESKLERKKLWSRMDSNGNGYLSLAEVDKCFQSYLPEVFSLKPVLIRAFNTAKTKAKAKNKGVNTDDYVTKSEFRYLLMYIRRYFEYN